MEDSAIYSTRKRERFPQGGIVDGVSSVSLQPTLYAFKRLRDFPLTFGINYPKSNVWAVW